MIFNWHSGQCLLAGKLCSAVVIKVITKYATSVCQWYHHLHVISWQKKKNNILKKVKMSSHSEMNLPCTGYQSLFIFGCCFATGFITESMILDLMWDEITDWDESMTTNVYAYNFMRAKDALPIRWKADKFSSLIMTLQNIPSLPLVSQLLTENSTYRMFLTNLQFTHFSATRKRELRFSGHTKTVMTCTTLA